MKRRRLWELSCPAKDAVLCTSFDRDELLRIAAATGVELDFPAGLPPESGCSVERAVHEACHSENAFSLRLEEILDGVHEETLRDVAQWGAERVGAILSHDLTRLAPVLPGLIWAVVTQGGPGFRRVETCLLWRVQTEALRVLAFGKVEVVGA